MPMQRHTEWLQLLYYQSPSGGDKTAYPVSSETIAGTSSKELMTSSAVSLELVVSQRGRKPHIQDSPETDSNL